MPTITDNLNLFKPDPGQSGVAAELNTNWDQLDFRFDEAGGHTHDGTPGQGPKVPVTSLATTGTPSATTYLRGDGLWTTGTGGGGGVTDHGALTGLADDDHSQYYNQSRGDTRYAQRSNNLSDLANTATARTNIGAAAAVHQHAGSDITTGTVPTARLGSGTPSTTTFLRGDQTWAVPGAGGSVNLDDLADVLITSPADNQVLSYDAAGARWINEAAAAGVTNEDIDDRVNALLVAGTGITKTYDDTANTLTLAATGASLPAAGPEGSYLAVNASSTPIWALGGGTTASRPTGVNRILYHRYFDTTLVKPITWDGLKWRDATGADMGGDTPTIITSGLIFGLSFAEGSGQTLAAVSGSSYGAVLGSTSGADANDPDWVTAGLDFVPGTSDLVTATGVPDTGWLGAMTVMVVAKVDAGGAGCFIQKQGGDGSTQAPLFFGTQGTSPVKLLTNRANSNWRGHTTSAGTMTTGSYRCYSAVLPATIDALPTFYTGTTATAGVVYASSGTGTATGSGANVQIGRGMLGSNYQLDGTIGYVLVYSRELSAGEIATNYTALQSIMAGRGVTLPLMDFELLTRLGPWAGLFVVVLLGLYVWERTHRPLKVDLTVTLKQSRNGGMLMGVVKPPPGIVAFTNYTAVAISDTGTWYFACLDKSRGCVVWKDGDQQPLLEHPGTQDYGAPSLVWDHTGRLIMCSCNEKGDELLVLPVPGVKKTG